MSHKLKFYQGVFLTTLSAAICSFVMANPTNMTASADSFQWLEDANASKALDWVKLQNGRSLGVLQNDPRYAGLYKDALAVVTANDRVPVPGFLKDEIVTNFGKTASMLGVCLE